MTEGNKRKSSVRSPLTLDLPPSTQGPATAVDKPVYVGRLETVSDWRRQVAKIFRELRRGELRPDHATRLVWIAQVGGNLAKMAQELETHRALLEELARGRDQVTTPAIPLLEQQREAPDWLKEENL